MANETKDMRVLAKKAVDSGMSKEEFVSRFIGRMAVLAAREYELITLGYYETVRR